VIAGNPAAQEVTMSRGIRLALLAAAGLVLAVPVLAQQAKPTISKEPIKPISDVSGIATFNAYCTVCHGPAGTGDGPAGKALTKPPADLTQLAKKNNGKFPAMQVKSTIEGDITPMAHGTRDMPMWGPVFKNAEGSVSEIRVKNLVDYIQSIQAR
jgi:mono/diheme cytochrome c family protein